VVTWRGMRLEVSKSAYRELLQLAMSLEDVVEVLEYGHAFPGKKRKPEVHERCLDRKGGSIKVVVAESFQYSTKECVWIVVHVKKVGRF